jgi:membrane associated rhomboid family serine protease
MIWILPWDGDHPSRHLPWATWALMAVNIAAYVLMPGGSEEQVRAWYLEWGLVSGDWHWYQFVTSAFMHGSWLHLVGNMFFLWVLGDNVEDALGIGGFLLLYLIGGFLGDLLYVSANDAMIPSVGASGCIAAVAGAYAVLFHHRSIDLKVIVLVFPIYTLTLRALWVLLFFFGIDVWMTLESKGHLDGGGGVNFVAHGIGFLAGVGVGLYAKLSGAMSRFDRLPNGDTWWGYLPARLEDEARRAQARERVRQRLVDEARRS